LLYEFSLGGLSLNLREIDWGSRFIWSFSLSMLVVAFAGKMIGAFLICDNWALKGIVGLKMVPRGEVGLIFAELGRGEWDFQQRGVRGLAHRDRDHNAVAAFGDETFLCPLGAFSGQNLRGCRGSIAVVHVKITFLNQLSGCLNDPPAACR